MPLDEEAKAIVEQMKAYGPRYLKSPQELRARTLAQVRANPAKLEPVARTEDRTIPGPGGDLMIRIFTPEGPTPMPIVSYIHGGGWILASVEGHEATCRSVANLAGAIVIATEFRLAPENKFPAALEDVYAATAWASANAGSIGGDPDRIAVMGNSSGGNLAAAVSLLARDRGAPKIACQVLVFPSTDYDFSTRSAIENAEGYGLTTAEMKWFWENYLHTTYEANNPYACPMRALDLRDLPPAVVLAAEFDPLRDDAVAYARRLEAAGVPMIYHCFEGMIHEFLRDNMTTQARRALHEAIRGLRQHLDQ